MFTDLGGSDDMSERDSMAMLRRDHTQLAAAVTGAVTEIGDLKKIIQTMQIEASARAERDKHMQKSLDSIQSLGRWALLALLGAIIAAIATFAFRGGFNVPMG